MNISVEQALTYAHAQVLEIIENHVASDIEDLPRLKEYLTLMAWDLQQAAGSFDLTQDS